MLLEEVKTRIVAGLQRQAISKCSKWAERYRIMGQPYPGPWTFKHHPWLREIMDAEDDWIVGRKAAQMGYTEAALNKVFYAIDILGDSVMYILPATTPDASNFSMSRFDPALEMSPHLSKLFSDVKNVGHKRAGNANLFIRGSRSRSQLKSVPAARLIFDELDEMVQDNIPLALERQSGQLRHQVFALSTPTIHTKGIEVLFAGSTQEFFFFLCPGCSKYINLMFPEAISPDPTKQEAFSPPYALICPECSKPLPHEAKPDLLADGHWEPNTIDAATRGFYINQLYSSTVTPDTLVQAYFKGRSNLADEQEFYNSKLGLPHEPQGSRITALLIHNAIGTYVSQDQVKKGVITMGIDVGKLLHYEITRYLPDGQAQVIKVGSVEHFPELDALIRDYNVLFAVIDGNPERRMSLEFARLYYGMSKICFYARGVASRTIKIHPEEECSISVDRSSWMESALGRFHKGKITLPRDIGEDYKNHLQSVVKIYENDPSGNPVARFVKGENAPDHFAHARTYSEIALQFVLSSGDTGSIRKVY